MKKSQITLFIIVGVVILVVAGFLLYILNIEDTDAPPDICGDGTCQAVERQTGKCPQDCEEEQPTTYDECDLNKDGRVDSAEQAKCEGTEEPEYDECDANKDGKVDSIETKRCGSTSAGKCGDGTCQPLEKQTGKCPEDCGGAGGDQPDGTTSEGTEEAHISVDFSSNSGILSDYLFGTIAGPKYDASSYPLLEDANFKLVEIQLSQSYPSDADFDELDNQIEATISAGAIPIIWFNQQSPVDENDYKGYVSDIVSHVKGIDPSIKLFRFGNEPDSSSFWKGTQEEYFGAYASFAEAVKSNDDNNVLIAPSVQTACKGGWSECDGTSSTASDFVVDFLDYLKENDVELDYFTFHGYSAIPYPQFYLQPSTISDLLKDYPVSSLYGTPKIGNDEWNLMVGQLWSGSYHSAFDTAWAAVSNINNLINMVDAGVSMSVRYGGTSNGAGTDFPLTDKSYDGKPSFYAFKGFNMLQGHYLLDSEGGDNFNLGVIAGKTDKELVIIVSNFDIKSYVNNYDTKMSSEYEPYASQVKTYKSYTLGISGLDWTGDLGFKVYMVDSTHNLELIKDETVTASSTLSFEEEIGIPSMHVIVISKQ